MLRIRQEQASSGGPALYGNPIDTRPSAIPGPETNLHGGAALE